MNILETILRKQVKTLSCKFSRLVESSTTFETKFVSVDENEIIAEGALSYSMKVTGGQAGELTTIQINADHEINQIFPRSVLATKLHLMFILKPFYLAFEGLSEQVRSNFDSNFAFNFSKAHSSDLLAALSHTITIKYGLFIHFKTKKFALTID